MTYFDVDWSPRFDFGGPRSVTGLKGVCVHTSEGNPTITAENLANYQLTSQTGSYHVIVDLTGKRLRENTDDWITWSSGNQGNNILLHICFTARADWTRQQWLDQRKMLRAGATVVAHWCETYRFPVRKVDTRSLPGILGHDDTRAWGGTDHTDPGKNFPYDVFAQMVNDVLNPPKNPGGPVALTHDQDTNAQLTGSPVVGEYPGFDFLGGRTVTDALGAIGAALKIPGFRDPKAGK
ncbi:N-acetylmuramoyl-L-alanine amidase [Prescottella equi]|uniref:Lysin n=1 Tax=Rhodococcus phage REQ2 TaxID=1109713 RepID=G9FH47_9CAUD|nr:N-acetylmuramoyl-L-alanine amidase [Prescottella equi]YP_005087066.1 endolysin [Rhodococcus phage REQ2]AEV51876.1 lysin [Rhodococcus phage REQ2]